MLYEGLSFTSGDGGDEMGEVKWGRGWGRGDGGDEIGDVKHYYYSSKYLLIFDIL